MEVFPSIFSFARTAIRLSKLCRQAAEAKEAGKIMEAAMQSLEKELAADKERKFQYQKEMQQVKGPLLKSGSRE